MATTDVIDSLLTTAKEEEQKRINKARADFADVNEQLTFGPEESTLSGSYAAGKGVWDIHFVDKLSPDVILMYLARMKQMYLAMSQPNQTGPTPRRVKDTILKDLFPVHTINDLM